MVVPKIDLDCQMDVERETVILFEDIVDLKDVECSLVLTVLTVV